MNYKSEFIHLCTLYMCSVYASIYLSIAARNKPKLSVIEILFEYTPKHDSPRWEQTCSWPRVTENIWYYSDPLLVCFLFSFLFFFETELLAGR